MPEPAAGVRLVVAISSRALFDFEEENELFDPRDDRPYIELQLSRLDQLAKPGVAFRLVRKLLGFNADGVKRVEVVILSRNDTYSGLRVMKSVAGTKLAIERAVFTKGREPWAYLRDLFCLLPSWSEHKLLELAPMNWKATRARADVQSLLDADRYRQLTLRAD